MHTSILHSLSPLGTIKASQVVVFNEDSCYLRTTTCDALIVYPVKPKSRIFVVKNKKKYADPTYLICFFRLPKTDLFY